MSSFRFTLYIAGDTARSQQAIANLKHICGTVLAGAGSYTVVDVTTEPDVAESRRILATPTLVRELPAPVRRLTGDLSQLEAVVQALALMNPNGEPS